MVVFMKFELNKKGFTLIELLAVIVILSIIVVFATNGTLTQLDKTRKTVLKDEAVVLVGAARQAYQFDILEGKTQNGDTCYTLEYLNSIGLYSKSSADSYTGSVLVSHDDDKIVFNYWISNGSHVITDKGNPNPTATSGESASQNCGDATVQYVNGEKKTS